MHSNFDAYGWSPGTKKKRERNKTGPSMVMLNFLLIVTKYFIVVINEIYMNYRID